LSYTLGKKLQAEVEIEEAGRKAEVLRVAKQNGSTQGPESNSSIITGRKRFASFTTKTVWKV
jgi:predicted trehalose synthase